MKTSNHDVGIKQKGLSLREIKRVFQNTSGSQEDNSKI